MRLDFSELDIWLERLPRFEGIETVDLDETWDFSDTLERLPRFEGIETLTRYGL